MCATLPNKTTVVNISGFVVITYIAKVVTVCFLDTLIVCSHSFGYECQKRSNLVVLSKETVAYAAGNMVILLNLSTQEQSFFRSLGGGGIGAIAVRYMSYIVHRLAVISYYIFLFSYRMFPFL